MSRSKQGLIRVLDKTATGVGSYVDVSNYRDVVYQISSSGSANFTVKFKASLSLAVPDFSAAASATNAWFYVQSKDLNNQASYDGNVGVVFTGTDQVLGCEINTNLIKWLCPQVTAISAGHVYVDLDAVNDTNY